MPEMIAAHITIGGQVRNDLVADLCALIAQEDLALDWDGKQFSPRTAEDLLAARQTEGLRIQLFADAASWGQFESLEQFLFEIASTALFYRPEFGCREYLTDANEEVVCPVQPLRSVFKMLTHAQLNLKDGHRQEAGSLIAECLEKLREHLPPDTPPLPAFEIV